MTANPEKQIFIHFKGNKYSAKQIRQQSGAGPMIEISTDALHEKISTVVHAGGEGTEETLMCAPVFTKHDGKYVVLLGLRTVMDIWGQDLRKVVKLKGRLLSNPVLKRCLV